MWYRAEMGDTSNIGSMFGTPCSWGRRSLSIRARSWCRRKQFSLSDWLKPSSYNSRVVVWRKLDWEEGLSLDQLQLFSRGTLQPETQKSEKKENYHPKDRLFQNGEVRKNNVETKNERKTEKGKRAKTGYLWKIRKTKTTRHARKKERKTCK